MKRQRNGRNLDAVVRLDLRTRAGREAECLKQIRKAGGFSVFWATEFMTRAHALERLQQCGRIKVRSKAFPWIAAKVRKPNTSAQRSLPSDKLTPVVGDEGDKQ